MEQNKTACPITSSSSSSSMAEDLDQEFKELLSSLPKAKGWTHDLFLYQGFWCPAVYIRGVISFQKHFQAQDQDILIASNPKSGTTWLKALTFSIVNRARFTFSTTPLLTSNPHHLAPFLELDLFGKMELPDLSTIPSPRLFSTHMPYAALPESIKKSNCSVVYICRNPFDAAVSLWHFVRQLGIEMQTSMDELFDIYFNGIYEFGPFWEQVLGYWKESLEKPDKVLFLKYEDLKEDIVLQLKRIAEFIGYPFSQEEEKQGVIEEIAKLCSLSSLKDLEANKKGSYLSVYPHKDSIRQGNVGEWADSISPSLKQHLENVMQEKLSGTGLSFKLSC
ncbi:Flavonol 4'-sulfotransferase, putative [Ricinus communis]|uniref:Sulfotransferase n=1 Tax=Ricinus communis TaxID=3988 RepID=B9SVG3_RICCO|nr:Flavonol 4'-sulfotransferase, putative [Ricinus communis]|eukprot:XP_002529982.1 cytosolic sulfotransferase 15 [Ricinus communis]